MVFGLHSVNLSFCFHFNMAPIGGTSIQTVEKSPIIQLLLKKFSVPIQYFWFMISARSRILMHSIVTRPKNQ